MTDKIKVSTDTFDFEIDISKAVAKELKKCAKVTEQLPEIYKSGRSRGNTYRILLYAQLLASSKDEANIFVLTKTHDNCKRLFHHLTYMMHAYGINLKANSATNTVEILDNRSRIHFRTREQFNNKPYGTAGLRNVEVIHDNY